MSFSFSYHSCMISSSDLALLAPGVWLNDSLIHFSFDYLAHDGPLLGAPIQAKARFISPQTTFMLMHEQDEKDLEEALTYGCDYDCSVDYLFFPLNDSAQLTKPGGSHWSLMVWDRKNKMFVHYDSIRGSNEALAKKFAQKLSSLVGSCVLFEARGPQQKNSADCGIYTIITARALAIELNKHAEADTAMDWNSFTLSSDAVSASAAALERPALQRLIKSAHKQAQGK